MACIIWAYMEDGSQRAINWKESFMTLFWSGIDSSVYLANSLMNTSGNDPLQTIRIMKDVFEVEPLLKRISK